MSCLTYLDNWTFRIWIHVFVKALPYVKRFQTLAHQLQCWIGEHNVAGVGLYSWLCYIDVRSGIGDAVGNINVRYPLSYISQCGFGYNGTYSQWMIPASRVGNCGMYLRNPISRWCTVYHFFLSEHTQPPVICQFTMQQSLGKVAANSLHPPPCYWTVSGWSRTRDAVSYRCF